MTGMHHIKADHVNHTGVPAVGEVHEGEPGSKRRLLKIILLAHVIIIVIAVLLGLVIYFATR